MNLAQAIGYQPAVLTESIMIGQPRTLRCEGRCCPDRTAPVFVAVGIKGALLLCEACRSWQHRMLHVAAIEIKRRAR